MQSHQRPRALMGRGEMSMKPMRAPGIYVAAAWLALMPGWVLAGPPDEPRVIDGIEIGKPGGELRMLIGRERETRFFNIYGYAHLIAYDHDLKLAPDILKNFKAEDGRI